jgi:LmbE family N-acetylglucosaminyl deacetylase
MLAPHPDDFDAIGVTLRTFHRNGHRIDVGVAYTGSGVEDSYPLPPTLETKAVLRKREQQRSCRFFGLPDACLTFLHLQEDAELHPLEASANLGLLRDIVLSRRPDIVFMPHGNDTNPGHQRMYAMFKRIASEVGYPLAVFLNRDPKTIDMRVDLYTEFGAEEARWKAQLLRFHDSQQQRNLNVRGHGLDERILAVNRQAAREITVAAPYAEVFELELHGV